MNVKETNGNSGSQQNATSAVKSKTQLMNDNTTKTITPKVCLRKNILPDWSRVRPPTFHAIKN